jgi:hypothetical protein
MREVLKAGRLKCCRSKSEAISLARHAKEMKSQNHCPLSRRCDFPGLPARQFPCPACGSRRENPKCEPRRGRTWPVPAPGGRAIVRPRRISCRHRFDAFDAAQACGVGDGGAQVSRFEVGIVCQDLLLGHVAAQQFQQKFHRIAQAADARFAVADVRVHRDAREQLCVRHDDKMTPDVSRRKREAEAGEKTSETVIQKIFDELPVP